MCGRVELVDMVRWLLLLSILAGGTPDDISGCPKHGEIHPGNGHCYWIGQGEESWHNARHTCQGTPGTDLAVVNNEGVQHFIQHHFSMVSTAWIGLVRSRVPGRHHWVDGSQIDSYQNWASSKAPSGDCVRLELTSKGIWKGSPCNSENHFICEKNPSFSLQNVNYFLTGVPTFSGTYSVKNVTVLTAPTLHGTSMVEIMLFPGLWFSHSGLVSSIEFVVEPLKKATRVHFKIFRPYCAPSSFLIPPGCESLRTPFASCHSQPLCNTTGGCMSGQQWCHLREQCLPITSPCSSYAFENISTNILPIASPPRYRGTQPFYSRVADIPMTITSDISTMQINVVLGDEDIHVFPDDVVGLQHDAGPGELLHCLPSSGSPWRQSYMGLVRRGWAESSLEGFQPARPSPTWVDSIVCDLRVLYTDQLRAVASTPSLDANPVSLVNQNNPTVTDCCPASSQTKIAGLQIIFPQPVGETITVPTRADTAIVVKIRSGGHAISWWGPPVHQPVVPFEANCPLGLPQLLPACRRETGDTWFARVRFAVSHPGSEVLNISVNNEVSSQNLSVVIQAHDTIQGLRIVPNNPGRLLVDAAQVFSAEVTHGTSIIYTWVIDDLAVFSYTGQTHTVIFKRAATYRLKLTAVNPVSRQSVTTELVADTMHPLMDPQFINVSNVILVNQPQLFVLMVKADSLAEVTFRWDFGDGSAQVTHSTHPQHSSSLPEEEAASASVNLQDYITWTYTQSGDYNLEVEVLAQQSHVRKSLLVYVRSRLLDLSCSMTQGHPTIGGIVTFEAFPRPSSHGILYTWSFGDGVGAAELRNATVCHRFNEKGVYNVSLVANNMASAVSCHLVVRVEEEIMGLVVTISGQGAVGSPTLVRAQASSGSNIMWTFDMGDGNIFSNLTTATLSHAYMTEGTYTLTVTASNGVSSASRSASVVVHTLRVVDITGPDCVTSGRQAWLQARVSGAGNGTRFRWSFGDGSPPLVVLGSPRAHHTYAEPGAYTVAVVASSPYGSARRQAAICVQAPIVSVRLHAGCQATPLRQPVRFVAEVVPPEDQQHPYEYRWDLGVSAPLRLGTRELTFNYSQPGIYLVTVHLHNRVDHCSNSCRLAVQEGLGDFTISHEGPTQQHLSLNKTYAFHLSAASGTNATFRWDFGDGSARGLGLGLSHVYRSPGPYTVTVVGENLVSRLEKNLGVWVLTPIAQLSLSTEQSTVETGEEVVFVTKLSAGDGASYFWAVRGYVPLHQGTSHFKYKFQEAGVYVVAVTARNEVSEETKTLTVQAEEKIRDLEISSRDLIQGHYSAAKEACQLHAHVVHGSNLSYQWTISRGPVTVMTGQGSTVVFQPAEAGCYLAVVLARNALGEIKQSKEIFAQERVRGMEVTAPTHEVGTGQLVHLKVAVVSGTDLQYEWSFEGDQEHLWSNTSSLSYRPTSAGTTVVTATAYNKLGSAQSSLTLRILKPISGVNHSITDEEPPCLLPSNATALIQDFADKGTNVSWEWSLMGDKDIQSWREHHTKCTFREAGMYLLYFNASNGMSWEEVHHNITVMDTAQGLDIVPDKASVGVGLTMTFVLRVQQASGVRYLLFFPNLSVGVWMPGATCRVGFSSAGWHNETARNGVSGQAFSSWVMETEEEEEEKAAGVHLVNCCQPALEAHQEMRLTAGLQVVNYTWLFHLAGSPERHLAGPIVSYTPGGPGLLIIQLQPSDQLDAPALTLTLRVQLPVVASGLWSDHSALLVGEGATFHMAVAEGSDVRYRWDFGDGQRTYTGRSGTAQHQYRAAGRYTVRARAFNDVSLAAARVMVTVRRLACRLPAVRLVRPLRSLPRAQPSYFQADVDLRGCTAYRAHYLWEAFNDTGCRRPSRLDLPAVDTTKPLLALPRLALPLGTHCLQFTVALAGTPLQRKVAAVVQVVQSRLVPIINGGAQRSWASLRDLVLDGSQSYDPDCPTEEGTRLLYHWDCQSTDQSTSLLIPTASCGGAVVSIPGRTLVPGATYTFTLTVSKPGREEAHTSQMVLIRAGKVPDVLLECISCRVRWSYGVSRSMHVTLGGRCANCNSQLLHKWTVQSSDGYPLILDNKTTSTGDWNADLVIRQGVLQDGVNYTFTLHITDLQEEITGFSSIILSPNYPPTGGVCSIHPDQVLYLLETPLSFNCTGWWDEDGSVDQLVYTLVAVTCSRDSVCERFQLYWGIKPSFSCLLPVGSLDRATAVSVIIEVEDILGARTTAVNRTLMVLMPDLPLGSHRVVKWLKRKSQSELWGLVQQGNPDKVIPFSIALISALNQHTRHHGEVLRDGIAIRGNVTLALASLNVTTLEEVTQVSAGLAQCAAFPDEFVRGQGLAESLRMSKQMIDIIGKKAGQGSATPTEAGRNILKVLGAAMAAIGSSRTNGNAAEIGLATPASIFKLTSSLAQSLMRSRVLNEELLSLSVSEIDVQGKRTDPFNLLCARPGDHCHFHVPRALSRQLSENRELVQVTMSLRVNPFLTGTASNGSISTRLGSMEFSSPQGLPIPVSGLSAETSIRVTLSEAQRTRHSAVTRTLGPGENISITIQPVHSNRAAGLHVCLQFTLLELGEAADPVPSIHVYVHNDTRFNGTADKIEVALPSDTGSQRVEHTIFLSPEVYDTTSEGLGVTISSHFSSAPVAVSVVVYTSLCQYFDLQSLRWRTDGIFPTRWTRPEEAVCLTHHLTVFGASLFVYPDAVQFLPPVNSPVRNAIVAITCALVFALYIMVALIAHKLDYIDINRVGIIPLCGQQGRYKHEVMVKTGWYRNSGTTAHVGISLYGLNKSGSRHLDKEGAFQRNGLDVFQVEMDANLGEIWKIRIWHDNTGLDPSWYLEHVAVWDKQTDNLYYFLAQDWLSVENEKNEGMVEKDVLAACPQELRRFSRIFTSQLKRGASEKHIWLSVWDRLPRSHFTRVQRVTCCTLLIYLFFTVGALWYGAVGIKNRSLPVAYLTTVTGETVAVGIVLAGVVFPIHLLFTFLFRRTRSKVTVDNPEPSTKETQSVEMDVYLDPSELGSSSFLSIPRGLDSLADESSESCESLGSKQMEPDFGFAPQLVSESLLNSWPSYDSLFNIPDLLNHDPFLSQNKVLKRKKPLLKRGSKAFSSSDEDPLSFSISDSFDSRSLKHHHLTASDEDLMRSIVAEATCNDKLSDQVTSDSGHFSPRAEMDLGSENLESSLGTWSDCGERKPYRSPSFISSRGMASSFLTSLEPTSARASASSTRIGISKSPRKWLFPHSALYVTYLLCFLLIAACISLTISYGMLFPNHVVLMWLISASFSFLTSFFFLEPLKVLCEALILALITKPVDPDEDDKLVEEPLVKKTSERIGKVRAPYGYSLLQAKEEARKVRALYTLMKNCIVHMLFLLVVLIINYQGCSENTNTRFLHSAIRQSVVGRSALAPNVAAVRRPTDTWQWIGRTLLPHLYNNSRLMLLGVPQLRQVRLQEGQCSSWAYRLFSRIDPDVFCSHFNSPNNKTMSRSTIHTLAYSSANFAGAWYTGKVKTHSSDQYTLELGNNSEESSSILKDLYQDGWIDAMTQTLVVEFTQYSRDVDLYAVVLLVVEFQLTIPLAPTIDIKPFSLLRSTQGLDLLVVSMVLLLLFSLVFLCTEAVAVSREGLSYFREGQRYLQLLVILLSALIPTVHFSRLRLSEVQLGRYKRDRGAFVSFHRVALLSETVTVLAALLLTILTMKTVGQLRFFRRWCVFGKTFQFMFQELTAATLIFFLLVMVYAHCGYLIFSPALEDFKTFRQTVLLLVVFPRGAEALQHAVHQYPTTASVYFTSYLLCLAWIVRNLFCAITIQNYRHIRAEMYRPAIEPQDYEMMEFFIRRFKLWIGLAKGKEFRHKVKFEGMESLPTGSSRMSRFSQLPSASTESHFSDCTISSGSMRSEEMNLTESPTAEVHDVEAYLDRLLPTINSLLDQFDRVNKVTDDLYRIETDLEKLQDRMNKKRRGQGTRAKSNAEKRTIPLPGTHLLWPRTHSAISESAVSSHQPSRGPVSEYSTEVVGSVHRDLTLGSRPSDNPRRKAWQSGLPLSAGISQRSSPSSGLPSKPRPRSEEGQDRGLDGQLAPVKRRAWHSECVEGSHQ
ncbi:polycystin-1 [Rhinoraja longicauda]